jgi:hypothetical protein
MKPMGRFLKQFSDFLARLPGLPVMIAVGLIVLNFLLQLLPDLPVVGWLAHTHLILHLGLVTGFVGILLGDAL